MRDEIDNYIDMYGAYGLTTENIARETWMPRWEVEEEMENKGYTKWAGRWVK